MIRIQGGMEKTGPKVSWIQRGLGRDKPHITCVRPGRYYAWRTVGIAGHFYLVAWSESILGLGQVFSNPLFKYL